MKITKNQLRQIIKEEAIKLQKKTVLENRKKEITRKLRMLNEEEGESDSTLEQIKDLLRPNKFLADKADSLSEDIVKDMGSSIYLQFPNELESPHIKKHFDKSSPASVWSISKDAVGDLILKTIKTKPTKTGQDGPAFKYKWLNINSGKNIGFDSLKKVDGEIESIVDLEPFGMVDRVKDWSVVSKVASDNNYELVTKDQKPYTEENLNNNEPAFIKQNVGVIYGDKTENPTSIFNLILAKIGEVNNKPVLTLMTIFPGINPVDSSGNDVTNKKDLIKHGYALIKPKSNVNESIRKIVRESFRDIFKSKATKENNKEKLYVDFESSVKDWLKNQSWLDYSENTINRNQKSYGDITNETLGNNNINLKRLQEFVSEKLQSLPVQNDNKIEVKVFGGGNYGEQINFAISLRNNSGDEVGFMEGIFEANDFIDN